AMLTAVNRDIDAYSSAYLHRSAYVAAFDFRHRFNHMWELKGSVSRSQVNGSPQAIASTQQDYVHYYQRPDAGLPYDTTATSLGGHAEEVLFEKVAGQHVCVATSSLRRSAGFDPNDLGFLRRADQQSWNNWFGY